MVKIVCKHVGYGPDGQKIDETFTTFDVDAPVLEEWLREPLLYKSWYAYRSVIGSEPITVESSAPRGGRVA